MHSKCKFIRCRLRKTHVRRKMAEIKNHKSKVLNKLGGKLSKQKKKSVLMCVCVFLFFFCHSFGLMETINYIAVNPFGNLYVLHYFRFHKL